MVRTSKLAPVQARLRAALTAAALTVFVMPARASAAALDFRAMDFKILNPATAAPIGKVHYDVRNGSPGVQTVTSDARYSDGQRDVERDEIDTQTATPTMIRSEHSFFHADGSRLMSSKIDLTSGVGACTRYASGVPTVSSERFAIPPDTYAGAGIMLPLQASLRSGDRGPITLHYFACMPGPKLVKLEAHAGPPTSWKYYPGDIVRADVKPDFGWLNYLIAPLLPEMHAWFRPTGDFALVGGQFLRFYQGPQIIIALDHSGATDRRSAQAAPRR